MEGGKKKASSSSSWADAVEREEQEEAQKRRKPDPFGAARPREVVLEERGVDWRELDQGLEKNNSVLREDSKKPKENIFSAPTMFRRVHERNKPRPQNSSPTLVPPIMYAPKNITTLMEQIRKDRRDLAGSSDVKSQSRVKKKPAVPAGESPSPQRRRRRALADANAGRANLEKYRCSHDYEKNYRRHEDCCRADRGMSFTCGDRKPEKTTSIGNRNGNRDSSDGGLEPAGYGVGERVDSGDSSNRCVDSRGETRMKRRLSMAESGARHEWRQMKQSRK